MKPLLLVAALALVGSGCNVARFTRIVPSTPNGTRLLATPPSSGEPGSVAQPVRGLHPVAPQAATGADGLSVGWQPLVDGQQYAVWRHDYSPGAPCNEFDSEPLAETNNEGTLCPSFVP